MRKTGVLDLRNAFEEEDARRLFANAANVPALIESSVVDWPTAFASA
jgi:hypothetical protein